MTVKETTLDFQCSHCKLKDKDFSYFEKRDQNDGCRVQVQNLPEGITENGVRNLFVTVGTPLLVKLNPINHSAIVLLQSMNQAELAVRDLHKMGPYYLNVTILHEEVEGGSAKQRIDSKINETNSWDFSVEETPAECTAGTTEDSKEGDKKTNEWTTLMRNVVASLEYNPSIRMRQEVLDFRLDTVCVSKGRGYMNMGKADRFVGGLCKFVFESENCKSRDRVDFHCEKCQSRTSKICWVCHSSYCSVACLSKSSKNHLECSPDVGKEQMEDALATPHSNLDLNQGNCRTDLSFPEVELASGCTVLMSSYDSMQSVFVRRTDEPWEEAFVRLCNVVAVEALKGGELEEAPEEGVLVLSKYHEDLCYYRARVSSKANGKISVFFVDFGNTQETDLADLKPLPESLSSVPGFAVRVHLKDVSEDSTLESVEYFNRLTAERIPLILNYDKSTDEVVLIEKDSNTEVNKTAIEKALPSWRKDSFVVTKLGETYYLDSMYRTRLDVKGTCSVIVSHFDESEFLGSDTFWVTRPDTDSFAHVNTRMRQQMLEYCGLLKDDCYLPRIDELCLAKENGEWHRCVNLESHRTTCCLLFLDDGHSSCIETKDIRKMVQDFTEAPSQAVCCVLAGDPKMKTETELRSKVVEYLKEVAGKRVHSVHVLGHTLEDDTYCLSFPQIDQIVMEFMS